MVPAGWYGDPQLPGTVRYFDGNSWTQHVAPAPVDPFLAPAHVGFDSRAHGAYDSRTLPRQVSTGSEPSDPVHWLLPTGRTWQSIAAGYVALFAIVIWFLGPFALGLGLWALHASSQGGAHGRGRAIFAVVVGVLSTLAMMAFIGQM